jgi:hypothetical protein
MVAIFVQTCSYFWLVTNTDLTPPLRRYNADALGSWLHCLMGLLALQPCWRLVGCIPLTLLEPQRSNGVYERWLPSRNFGQVRYQAVGWTYFSTPEPLMGSPHIPHLQCLMPYNLHWDVWLSTTEGLRANSSYYHKWEVILLSFKTAVVNCWLSCHLLTSLIHIYVCVCVCVYYIYTHILHGSISVS